MTEILLRAALAGLAVALVAGPLGCLVVWRRMAYFGDTLSHGALLGVTLGVVSNLSPLLGALVVSVVLALLLVLLQSQRGLASDTLLGVLSHGSLALGLVALSLLENVRVDLLGYLFGDILAVSWLDLSVMAGTCVVVAAMLVVLWRPLLAIAVHRDLAVVEGVNLPLSAAAFMVLIALFVAVSMKVVGVLLVTAMLIIPAATARRLAQGPESMALWAMLLGGLAVVLGLVASLLWDTPAGPSIVLAAVLGFTVTVTLGARRHG